MQKIKIPQIIFRYTHNNPTPEQLRESKTRLRQAYSRLFNLAMKKLVEGRTKNTQSV